MGLTDIAEYLVEKGADISAALVVSAVILLIVPILYEKIVLTFYFAYFCTLLSHLYIQDGTTVLMAAASKGLRALVEYLVDEVNVDIDAKDNVSIIYYYIFNS